MRLLLTGATGFLGRALAEAAAAAGLAVIRVVRAKRSDAPDELALGPGPWRRAHFDAAIAATAPEIVLHAAGLLHAHDVAACFEANTILAAELLDAVAQMAYPPRVLLIGSAAELGFVPVDVQPVDESFACAPRTVYGIAKYAQTRLGLNAAARGLPVLVVRLFNLIGPDMPAHLALPSFARQIVDPAISSMRVGDLAAARDFLDVAEASRILLALAMIQHTPWPMVNLCSGRARRLDDLLEQMLIASGRHLRVNIDPTLRRPGDSPTVWGDTSRLTAIGLTPRQPDLSTILPAILRAQAKLL